MRNLLIVLLAAVVGFLSAYIGADLAAWYENPSSSVSLGGGAPLEPPKESSAYPVEEAWQTMIASVQERIQRNPGKVGIYIKDLRNDRVWTYGENEMFPSASLVKLPIMATVFQRVQEGKLSLDKRIAVNRRYRMGGSGRLKWFRDGSKFTLRDVIQWMITESDNTAMKMAIDTVGFAAFQEELPRFGFRATQVNPEGLSLSSGRVSRENYTTAAEMGMFLEKLYRKELVSPTASEIMTELMKKLPTRKRLATGLPYGWQIAHKTGLLRQACHDVGIVYTPEGDYIICVLTGKNSSYRRAKELIASVGKTMHQYFRSDSSIIVNLPAQKSQS